MEFASIRFSTANGVARIELNRPQVLNALNRQLIDELTLALAEVRVACDIRALIVSGTGGNFAAGADIAEMVDLDPEGAAAFSFSPAYDALASLPVPVIAAVDGYALGGGLELALACDIRICTPKARFGLPEIKIGIFPGAGGTQRLPRLIGHGRAREMIYTGKMIDAATAVSWGLCSQVIEDDLGAASAALAARIAGGPPLALAAAKAAMENGMQTGLGDAIAQESALWAGLFTSTDQKEGMRTFMEKRKPLFRGK